jgi:hypothetical protein
MMVDVLTERVKQQVRTNYSEFNEALKPIIRAIQERELAVKEARDNYNSVDQPFKEEMANISANRGMIESTTRANEQTFNNFNMAYVAGMQTIGPNANLYQGRASDVKRALYNNFVWYFCDKNSANAPPECGTKSAGALGVNIIESVIGEKSFNVNVISKSLELMRAFYGLQPTQLNFDASASDVYVERQSLMARSNLRMGVLHRLAARRTPVVDSGFFRDAIKMLAATGVTSITDPEIICAQSNDGITALKSLCGMLGVSGRPSKAVLDRYSQYDFYMNPGFLTRLYSFDYSPDGALLRLRVSMQAQRLAQSYQQLQDLQSYVAMRAMNIMPGINAKADR